MSTVTIQLTEAPPHSKRGGPNWIGVETTKGDFTAAVSDEITTIETEDDTVTVAGSFALRRARADRGPGRADRCGVARLYKVTGDPAQTVTFVASYGYLEARLTGVKA